MRKIKKKMIVASKAHSAIKMSNIVNNCAFAIPTIAIAKLFNNFFRIPF